MLKQFLLVGGLPHYGLGILAVLARDEPEAKEIYKNCFGADSRYMDLVKVCCNEVGLPCTDWEDVG